MNDNDTKKEDEILIEEPEDEIETLDDYDKFKLTDVDMLENLSWLAKKTYPYTVGIVVSFLNYLEKLLIIVVTTIVNKVVNNLKKWQDKADIDKKDYLLNKFGYSQQTYDDYIEIKEYNTFAGFVVYMFLLLFGITASIAGGILNFKTRIIQKANEENPAAMPDISAILAAYIKQGLGNDEATLLLRKHGLTKYRQQVYLDAIKSIPDMQILFENLWREKITPDEFNKYLAKLAYDKDEQVLINNVTNRIPPIQDIIRFAVREAFHEALSLKYRHDEEFPEEVGNWSEKQGFSKDWAKKYWRAHWELPSVQMAFEMLHRKVKKDDGSIFVKEDIFDLLKMQDYAPTWRNLLEQISYRVITRVDARRMYDLGIWDNLGDMTAEEKLQLVYESQGYNVEDAGYMVDFTKQYHLDRRKGFTKTGLKKIYKYGIISEDTYREKLKSMRIRNEEIEFLIDESNYEIEDKKLDSFMDYIKAMYQNDRMSKSDVQLAMSTENLNIDNPQNLFDSWDYDKKAKRRVLSKTDIQRLINNGIIGTRQEGINEFLDMGYSQRNSEWLTDEQIDIKESEE